MTITTKFNVGDEVANGKKICRIMVRYDSQYPDMRDIHYILSDGYYKSEKEVEDDLTRSKENN